MRLNHIVAFGLVVLGTGGLTPSERPTATAADPESPREVFAEAVRIFFDCRPDESSRLFDRLVELRPSDEPSLWQRGLALYYADRFDDGRRQFEVHRTVNPDDVENAAWHFLCVARAEDAAKARAALLPVGPDARVPMQEIYRLFAGDGSAEEVLAAAERGNPAQLRDQRCYAHLYLGLYHESLGNSEKARDHILKAAIDESMDHYMGRVARVHTVLRGWGTKAEIQP
ncbi:MAG: tetratricopeptide repeat protein [Planctomycetaceae bacterium]